ncbi:OLC1v1009747C1 [Oldenlandia corymbosa var. corymbosa]|uniref:OLC1v1009747C1 n=1 Tax=Oldenlandia corymbosa var. corymbosa TaxID=529605 RepID=A0AAV1DPP7_OLDCO|nr:OLC1v1009747C1 [Oldenlandia corymbosa var. corymbosa]
MAFVNRIGNVLKQTLTKHVGLESSAASNSMFYQAIRSMSTKLFVGGLSYGTDESSLSQAFSQHGEVVEAKIIIDRDSGRSRGFGFVTFASNEDAAKAMQAWDGQDLHGRRLRVNYATEKPRAPRFDGNFGGGGGGYGYPTGPYGGGGGGGGYDGGNFTNNYNPGGSNYNPGGSNFGGGLGNSDFGDGGNPGGRYANVDSTPSSFGGGNVGGPYDPSTEVDDFASGGNGQFDAGISDEEDKDKNEEPSDYVNRSG